MEENNNEFEKVNDNGELIKAEENKVKNKVFSIASTILVGLVFIAIMTLLVLSLTSPKNRFFKLVNTSFSGISKEISKFENSVFGKLLAVDTGSKLGISATITGKIETDNEDMKEWFQGLNSFKMDAKGNADYSNDYTETNINFDINDENFLSGQIIKNKDLTSVNLENITNGFVTVNNNNLSELWEKIGYNGPASLDNSIDVFKELDFSKNDISDIKTVINKFATGFSKAFDDDDFSYGTGNVEYDEGTIECKTMDFIVNATDLNEALIGGLEEITSKEKYVDTLYKIVSALDKISGYEPLPRDEFGTNFEAMVEQIRALEFSSEDEGFIFRVYYKGNNILKLDMLTEDYNTKILSFTCVNNGDSAYYKYSEGITVYEDKVTVIDGVTTHYVSVNYINYETGEIIEGYGSDIIITLTSDDDEAKVNLIEKVRLFEYDENMEDLDLMSIEPTVVRDYTFTGSIKNNTKNWNIAMIDADNYYKSTFSVEASINEKAKFEQTVIKENENFDTANKSDTEILAKKDEIVNAWKTNPSITDNKVQQFSTAVSMYLSMFIPVDYYNTYSDVNADSIILE